jgi:hypothetical protein
MSVTKSDLDAAKAATARAIAEYRDAAAKNDVARVSYLLVEIGRAHVREKAIEHPWTEPEPTAAQDEQIARLQAARPPSKFGPQVLEALALFDEAFADANTVAVTAARWAAEYAAKRVFGEHIDPGRVGEETRRTMEKAVSELQEEFASIVAVAVESSNKHKV